MYCSNNYPSKRIPAERRIGPHNIDVLTILIGSLLGDGYLEKRGVGTRFCFYQEKSHAEYLLWLHSRLSELGYCKPEIPKIRTRSGIKGERYILRFITYTFSSFNWIYEGFYPKGLKVLPDKWPGKSLYMQGILIVKFLEYPKVYSTKLQLKNFSGWYNYSCKVITYKIIKNLMDNRGSKSILFLELKLILQNIIVKEQRVDDNLYIRQRWFMYLRRTLMGFERNCQIKIPFYQINKKSYTSIAAVKLPVVHSWFLSGFIDSEGCFFIHVRKRKEYKTGWSVELVFNINLHQKDEALLQQIKIYLGVGNITKLGKNMIQYRVLSQNDLKIVLSHLDKYPLITKKRADFELFKKAFELIQQKKHLTLEGLHNIVAIKSSMNRGLSNELKAAFIDISPTHRPNLATECNIPDPGWLAGFTSGDGSFLVKLLNPLVIRVEDSTLY